MPTILIVEDDPSILRELELNLGLEGFVVVTATDGRAGLRALEDHDPDLVILDVMLPEMNGYEVCRRLRERDHTVPVLMLSAKATEVDRVMGLDLGADDYVVKPFVLRELMARVRAGIRRRAVPAAQPPAVLFRGPLRIEIDRRRVVVGEREVVLRPKEYGLLLTLALTPGRVFSRQDLLDAVWGTDVIVDERTVDVHISWLRGKLSDAGLHAAAIRTVYGSGYRFVNPTAAELATGAG